MIVNMCWEGREARLSPLKRTLWERGIVRKRNPWQESLLTLDAYLPTLNLLAILLFVYLFIFNLWTFVICSFIAN